MEPKKGTKRKELASSSQATADQRIERDEAMQELQKRPIVVERGVKKEGKFGTYITEKGWDSLAMAKYSLHQGRRSLYYDFFIELVLESTAINSVPVQGKTVDISAKAINAILELPNIPNDEYTQFLEAPLDTAAITKELTGAERNLYPDWRYLEKKWLTPEAKLLNTFVSSWLMPTVMNSEVLRKRALMIYALSRGMSMDVGRVINAEIHAAVNQPKKRQSIGFPALITTLCFKAGIHGNYEESDLIPWKNDLKIKDFHPEASAGPRTSQSPPSSSAQEDQQQEQPVSSGPNAAIDKRLDQLEARMENMQLRMEEFFKYQVAVNQFVIGGQQGAPPSFPEPSSGAAPPSPPQP